MGLCSWDPASEELLRQLLAQGLNTREIGDQLRRSRNAIVGKAHRLRLLRLKRHRPVGIEANGKRKTFAALPDAKLGYSNTPAPGYPGKPLLELRDGECRYPFDNGDTRLFCAAPVAQASSWCEFHYRICYTPEATACFRFLTNSSRP